MVVSKTVVEIAFNGRYLQEVLEFHPVADIFPLLEGTEFDVLVEDIREHGLREPIWVHEGKIIDGRNRYRACRSLGIDPSYREWHGQGSLVAFVVSLNLLRHHLSASDKEGNPR